MKILITGGAGFIGSHLTEKLLQEGHAIYVLDDLSTGSLANIKPFLKNPRFIFKKGSILKNRDLADIIKRVDNIYHLAAAVGVKYIIEKPLYSMINNIEGTHNVLRHALPRKIPVLITSSSEVYGKLDNYPFKEDADRMYGSAYNERWGYALSKAVDEFKALAYWREHGLPVVVVRLFNTVGARQTGKYGMVIPTLIAQARANEPMTVYGTGLQTRCFGHVHDVTNAMIRLMKTKKAYGEIVNLGSNESICINDLAKKIKQMLHSRSSIVHIPYKKAYSNTFEDMQKRIPDLRKAFLLIRYRPTYTLDEILRSMIFE